jgi:hypothetical protein
MKGAIAKIIVPSTQQPETLTFADGFSVKLRKVEITTESDE